MHWESIKSHGLNVDCAVYDLEDSVSPDMKSSSRHRLSEFLNLPRSEGVKEVAVRINSVDNGHGIDDLAEIVRILSDHIFSMMLILLLH